MTVRHEEFETTGTVTLDVSLPAGRLEVETGPPGATTVVELEPLGGEEAQRVVDEARVEARTDGDRTRVIVQIRGQRRFLRFGSEEVLVRAYVPERADLEASNASADVRTRGLLGAARVEVASGDVDVEALAGAADISSASGDVKLG